MSIVCCDSCGGFIDSDDDPECFVEVPWLNLADKVWCESCRIDEWNAHEAQQAKGDAALSLAREV